MRLGRARAARARNPERREQLGRVGGGRSIAPDLAVHPDPASLSRRARLGENTRMSTLQPGTRLRSAVCTTEVMVIQAPAGEVSLTCGGAPMLGHAAAAGAGAAPAPGHAGGTQIGKRYVDASGQLELLCTKAGAGSLAADGAPLAVKGAKPLPSSD
jgi:hypothetical protein